jgi:hypothetical protein
LHCRKKLVGGPGGGEINFDRTYLEKGG